MRQTTIETLARGEDAELCRFVMGRYGYIFARTAEGEFALIAAGFDGDIPIKIHRTQVIRTHRLGAFRAAVNEALDAFEASRE